jgi:hypothetical protein
MPRLRPRSASPKQPHPLPACLPACLLQWRRGLAGTTRWSCCGSGRSITTSLTWCYRTFTCQTWMASSCWSALGWSWTCQSLVSAQHPLARLGLPASLLALPPPGACARRQHWGSWPMQGGSAGRAGRAAGRPAVPTCRRPRLCLPAVMSSNGETNVVLRGVTHGAVDFLIKPVRLEELRNLWQHVVRRRSIHVPRASDEHSGLESEQVCVCVCMCGLGLLSWISGTAALECRTPLVGEFVFGGPAGRDAAAAERLRRLPWLLLQLLPRHPSCSHLSQSPACHPTAPPPPALPCRPLTATSARRARRCRCSTRPRGPTRSRGWCGLWRCTSRWVWGGAVPGLLGRGGACSGWCADSWQCVGAACRAGVDSGRPAAGGWQPSGWR